MPVDFIVAALLAASSDPEAIGETLHLVDPDPVSSAELARLLSHGYASREPTLRVPGPALERSLRIKRVRDYFSGAPAESIRYLNHPVRFDTRRATQLLARHDMSCPRFQDYVANMIGFFREHESDPAFVPPEV